MVKCSCKLKPSEDEKNLKRLDDVHSKDPQDSRCNERRGPNLCEHNREKRRCIECGGSAAAASPSQESLSSGEEVGPDENVDTAEPEQASAQGTAAVEEVGED
jgi:hypothetical protein